MDSEKQSPYYNIFLKLIEELKVNVRNDMAKPEQPQLTIPAGIKFWVGATSGKVQGLLFNNNRQALMYCDHEQVFTVESAFAFDPLLIKECLPMTPCKYEDLEPGDFFAYCKDPDKIQHFRLVLPDVLVVGIHGTKIETFPPSVGSATHWKVGK